MSDGTGGAGGAAMGAGGTYQARIAGFLAVSALAERDAQPPFALTSPVVTIACEGSDPVDDVTARTVDGHTAAIQAKRSVSLNRQRAASDGTLTPFASAIDQFVRQYHVARARAAAGESAALDPTHDRFILAVGSTSPDTIRQTLAKALDRIRILPDGEPLLAPVLNRQERVAVEALIAHSQASWEEVTGSRPTDAEVHEMFRFIRIQTVAVEAGEVDERAALTLLRQSVLRSADDARQAWSVIVEICGQLISTRSSIGVLQLRRTLEERGIRLRGARSYREDVGRLHTHTAAVLAHLANYATIPIGDERIGIERPYAAALRTAAENGSVLVVGEPGIGKSGAMYGFAHALLNEGRDAVILTPQDPPFSSLAQLRDALSLEHDVADVLADWPGDGEAFLIIDALDAARTDASAHALRQLIDRVQQTCPRWRVVASVREYDARYGRELQRLFRGEVPSGPSPPLPGPAFAGVRHLVVGELVDSEVEQLAQTAPRLHALVDTAPPALARLFRTPFNLRLGAELLAVGIEPAEIQEVGSQLELLDLYWGERVLAGGESRQAHAREAVLAKTVRAMLRERSLRTDTQAVADDPAASGALSDLLSAHVLTEWSPSPHSVPDRYTLTFAHHVLFDYAVKRLVLPRDPARLAELLAADPAFVLLARPSLTMHFHELWSMEGGASHREFWIRALAVAGESRIPEIGKLLGPSVAAELMSGVADAEPLLTNLESDDASIYAAAENAFYHLIRSAPLAVRTGASAPPDRVGSWCAVLERVSRHFTGGTAYPSRTLLWDLTSHFEQLEPKHRQDVGVASRRLLEFAWGCETRDRHLVAHALQFVCRTFKTDQAASAALLRRAVSPEHLAAFGSEELHWIASEIGQLAALDPDLVRDVYASAFSYREESSEPTPMSGIVMPMTSNRRQDYETGLYGLRQAFPRFLSVAPEQAVAATHTALEAYVERERMPGEVSHDAFEFRGANVYTAADYSHIWDSGHARPGDYVLELLDEVEAQVTRLAESGEDLEELGQFVDLVGRGTRLAVVWRRLLRLGERYPATLGILIRPLLWAEPILTGAETAGPAGRLIASTAPHLPREDRERIERSIMKIPENAADDRREWLEQQRDRLLGCFGEIGPVTPDARARWTELRTEDAVPPIGDDRPSVQVYSRPFGEKEYLAEQGVPVDELPNQRIRDLEASVHQFASEHSNSPPDAATITQVLPDLRTLRQALDSADSDGVDARQATYAWGILADACAAVVGSGDLDEVPQAEDFARETLIVASYHPDPAPTEDADSDFVRPCWGTPAARIDAAQGLIVLAGHAPDASPLVTDALDRLMADPVPPVRYQLAIALHRLYEKSPNQCWDRLEQMVAREASPGVALALLQGPLYALRFVDANRAVRLTLELYSRFAEGEGSADVRNACVSILANLYVVLDHADAGAIITGIHERLLEHLDEASHLVPGFREALVLGAVEDEDPDVHARRRRALTFVQDVTTAAAQAFREGVAVAKASDGQPRDDAPTSEQLEALAHLLDSVALNMYFASGAYEDEEGKGPEPAAQARLLREAGSIIDELADVGLAPVTHHVLETLEVLIPYDPSSVFMKVVAVIQGGRKGNYQYDQMAEEVLVRVVEHYLADYRAIFHRDEKARRALIETLDTFVRAGSEGARRLTYGLEGIFR